MASSSRKLNRPIGSIPYRKVFYIFPEGSKTEPRYFSMLKRRCNKVTIQQPKPHKTKTEPNYILRRVKKFIKDERPNKNDEVWIVADVDGRAEEIFQALSHWSKEKINYGLAISCPKFEYWLLLHFDKGDDVCTTKDCENRLKAYMPNYNKSNFDVRKLEPNIEMAIANAKRKDKNRQPENWKTIGTTVYKLVEKILHLERS